MLIDFDWFAQPEIQNIINVIYKLLGLIRIIVPIGLIVMTSLDITKKVINPEEKDGQKKIMIRLIAAIIVFFVPVMVRLIFKLADINIDNIGKDTNPIPTTVPTTKPTSIPTVDPNVHIDNLSITNCPNTTAIYHKNDSITLNSNIPNTYKGEIKWSLLNGSKYVNLAETNNGRSVSLSIQDVQYDNKLLVQLETDGNKTFCSINIEKEKLSNIEFLNCPSNDTKFHVGDELTLKTDIPSTFGGDVSWIGDEASAVKLTKINNSDVVVKIIDQPKILNVWITVSAGGKANTCHLNIEAVEELKITNCPSDNKIYHVGDKIILKTNLPSYYKGNIIWQSSSNPDVFKFTNKENNTVLLEILKVPDTKYAYIGLGADSKSTICKINIE